MDKRIARLLMLNAQTVRGQAAAELEAREGVLVLLSGKTLTDEEAEAAKACMEEVASYRAAVAMAEDAMDALSEVLNANADGAVGDAMLPTETSGDDGNQKH